MDARQLENFLAIVEHGSFTAAAAELRLSQPALSRAIKALETQLGVALFYRLPRGTRLTPGGEALLPVARKLHRDVQAGISAVRGVAELEAGRLDIACLATLAINPVAPIIGRLRRLHPGLTVRVLQPSQDHDVRQLIHAGDCEIGFTDLPTPEMELAVIALEKQQLMAVLPPGEEPPGAALTLDQLGDLDLVLGRPGTPARRIVEDHLVATGRRARVAVEVSRRDPMEHLVLAGAGATLLPEPLARYAEGHGAVVLPLDPPIHREVQMLTRREGLTPAAQAFVDEALATGRGG